MCLNDVASCAAVTWLFEEKSTNSFYKFFWAVITCFTFDIIFENQGAKKEHLLNGFSLSPQKGRLNWARKLTIYHWIHNTYLPYGLFQLKLAPGTRDFQIEN